MQIAAFQRKRKRPLLTTLDRLFWVSLRSVWSDWRHPLLYVQPDTVVRWKRERFRKILGQAFYAAAPASRSARYRRGTPPINRANGRRQPAVARTEDSWRTEMLGIAISERTVSRILRRLRRPPNQTWTTFLRNHVGANGIDRFLYRANNYHESAVCFDRVGTRWSQGAAFQCDRASDRRVDGTIDRTGVRRTRSRSVSHPRSRQQVQC